MQGNSKQAALVMVSFVSRKFNRQVLNESRVTRPLLALKLTLTAYSCHIILHTIFDQDPNFWGRSVKLTGAVYNVRDGTPRSTNRFIA